MLPPFSFSSKIKRYLNILETYTSEIYYLVDQIKDILYTDIISQPFKLSVQSLETFPGVGFITAVTIACEIGDISRFSKFKQLTAPTKIYFFNFKESETL